MRRTKRKDRQPQGGEDRAKFDKLRDHLLRLDDEVTCKTCGKKFEVPSHQSMLFTDQLEGLPKDDRTPTQTRSRAAAGRADRSREACRRASRGPQRAGAADAIVFYISGHGFGHASRAIEVINALDRSSSGSPRHHSIVGRAVAGRAHRARRRRTVAGRSRHRRRSRSTACISTPTDRSRAPRRSCRRSRLASKRGAVSS